MNKKNIDRLFQEKFKDFDVVPDDAVWDRIHDELHSKKKKRRVIPIWWKLGGVAAGLILALTVGISFFNSDENQTPKIVNTDKKGDQNTIEDKEQNKRLEFENSNKEGVANQDRSSGSNNSEIDLTTTNKESHAKKLQRDVISDKSRNDVVANRSKTNLPSNTKNSSSDLVKPNLHNQINNKSSSVVKNNNIKEELNSDLKSKTNSEIDKIIKGSTQKNSTAISKNVSSTKDDVAAKINKDIPVKEAITIPDPSKNEKSIEAVIADLNALKNDEEVAEKLNRWSVAPNVAPVYFSSFGQGSTIHSQFNQNTKSGNFTMSYGINGGYAINNKLKVRAGVKRVDLSYATEDVLVFTGEGAQARGAASGEVSNLNLKNANQALTIISTETLNRFTAPSIVNARFEGALSQNLSFIEVPLELEYKLLDKKFGINVIGGFSTFFLNDNEILADIDGNETSIGEANNINSTSYSANFGIGLNYGISKNMNFNLEPTFKYQINTFNNTSGNFQPFFIGVYTGLNFKF